MLQKRSLACPVVSSVQTPFEKESISTLKLSKAVLKKRVKETSQKGGAYNLLFCLPKNRWRTKSGTCVLPALLAHSRPDETITRMGAFGDNGNDFFQTLLGHF
nr:hypothetical protein [Pandoravirus massiliensis]